MSKFVTGNILRELLVEEFAKSKNTMQKLILMDLIALKNEDLSFVLDKSNVEYTQLDDIVLFWDVTMKNLSNIYWNNSISASLYLEDEKFFEEKYTERWGNDTDEYEKDERITIVLWDYITNYLYELNDLVNKKILEAK